ncbi:MAG: amidase [Gemmatimonadaceae bacterium]
MTDDHTAARPAASDRRTFIRQGGAALALASIPSLLHADAPPTAAATAVAAHGPTPPILDPGDPALTEFHEITIGELGEGMRTGRWTSRMVVEWYLAAIERTDRSGATLNSVLEVNPDALAIADALDAERREKGPRGPLHGVPILLKDNIGTADRLHTSAGSLALAESIAPRDAFLVERLRAGGAVILGKANMSEWANARGRASIGGWSGRGRLTRNPYALDRSAGGSSSGTAAAVSANLATAAFGTETMGSIVSPAALCGVVGLKPTVGLISRAGIIPVSYTQDTAGPMTRTVRDAALLLSAVAGADPRDRLTADAARHAEADYTTFLDPNGLRGARIGVARNLFGSSLVSDRVVERALDTMKQAGAVIVDPADIETADGIWTFDAEVLSFELKASLNEYLASLGPRSPVKSLADLIAFNVRNSDREMAWFGQETFEYAQGKGPLTSPEYLSALQIVRQLSRTQGIDATLQKHRLDAIVAPTQSPAWLTDVLLGDNTMLGSFVTPAAAGYPSITVPAGDVAGLPVGILFMGTAWSEGKLLRLAFGFEQTLRARRSPNFLPTIVVRP